RRDWRERLHANPSRMEQELGIKLQEDGIRYRTQVEIPVSTADFYFALEPRPLLVFVDGPSPSQNSSDAEGRRTTITITGERIQNPGIMLQQLLGQKERSALPGNSEQLR